MTNDTPSGSADELRLADPDAFDPDALARPVLIWDGDCGFCRRSAQRLRRECGTRLGFAPYQQVHQAFDDIDEADFARAVHLVMADGRVYTGAEAILRSRAVGPAGRWGVWLYERMPGFGHVAERVYRWVAEHRPFMSRWSTRLVGTDLGRPTWQIGRSVALRLVAVASTAAFISLFVQLDTLIGAAGIHPAAAFIDHARRVLVDTQGASWLGRLGRLPTVFWLGATDPILYGVCVAGVAASVGLFVGVWPRAMLGTIWLLYGSFVVVGGVFFGYQWDALLLETAAFGLFVAPRQWWPGQHDRPRRVGRGALFLMHWLYFRLVFMSGVVKLEGGGSWTDLSAMNFHYWTQPLPNGLSYWVAQLPGWFHQIETAAVLVIELVVAALIFAPRRLRHPAGVVLGLLQLAIAATGNFGFFNLLALGLTALLFDDRWWQRWLPRWLTAWAGWRPDESGAQTSASTFRDPPAAWRQVAVGLVVAVVVGASVVQMARRIDSNFPAPAPITAAAKALHRGHLLNAYGLFAHMTTKRPEILIQASRDGQRWTTYDFAYKPDHVDQRPPFVGLHMPRLDWQMWFAGLGRCSQNRWLVRFQQQLLEGNPAAEAALADNPFPTKPPTYIRTVRYHYAFTSIDQKAETDHWWRRQKVGPYCPTLTLQDGTLIRANPGH